MAGIMKKIINPHCRLLFTGLVLSMVGMFTTQGAQFKVGEPFPNWFFPALSDNGLESLAKFRGQKLILHIFASW